MGAHGYPFSRRHTVTCTKYTFLDERRPACADAKRTGRYGIWIASTEHDWFIKWPERLAQFGDLVGPLTHEQSQQLADAIEERRKKISIWFKNHKNRERPTFTLPPDIAAELSKGKAGRCPQAREVYCRLQYGDDKKAIVAGHLASERARRGRKLTRSERMSVTREVIDGMYAAESQQVKAEVLAKLEEETQAKKNPPAPTASTCRTPREYQNAVDSAPSVIEKLLLPVVDKLGWCVTVTGAGPCPEEGGAIRSFSVHFGVNQSGHSLPQVTQDYRDRYITPMVRFAKGVYPPDVRARRALPTTIPEDDEDDEDEAGPSGTSHTSELVPSSSEPGPSSSPSMAVASTGTTTPSAAAPLMALDVLSEVAAASVPLAIANPQDATMMQPYSYPTQSALTFEGNVVQFPPTWNQYGNLTSNLVGGDLHFNDLSGMDWSGGFLPGSTVPNGAFDTLFDPTPPVFPATVDATAPRVPAPTVDANALPVPTPAVDTPAPLVPAAAANVGVTVGPTGRPRRAIRAPEQPDASYAGKKGKENQPDAATGSKRKASDNAEKPPPAKRGRKRKARLN
ncbi:hypothetical protein C8T65DRAFT_698838 [Cerioporus squamosus]|nr:hypothetical protein C8T65DRAFT_698838 [Cerioporus squamosus]